MINYVNNAYDKTLKACDAQQFSALVASSETERLILAHRGGDARAKAKLPALTYMGVLDTGKYKQYLHQCEEQGTKPLGSRRVEFMRPTGLFMLDFDHVADPLRDGVILNEMKDPSESQAKSHCEIPLCARDDRSAVDSPVKLWEYIVGSYDNVGLPLAEWVALAHITPSGDGLRVVVKRTQGATIEQEQYAWCKAMKLGAIGIKPDAACKDISRLSFAPMQQEILYFNPSLLFAELPEAGDYPDGTLFSGVSSRDGVILSNVKDLAGCSCERGMQGLSAGSFASAQDDTKGAEQYPTDYNGIEYGEIVKRLEEQLGGRPEHGARNSFIFTMACNLRYICNDDPQWIAAILPTYGEDAQKHRATIVSAVNRPMSRTMPETLARALRISKAAVGDSSHSPLGEKEGAPPLLPAVLPEPIALLTSRTPEQMVPAVAMAVFAPLGAHLYGTEFIYIDNRPYEATFMTLLMAKLSSGKSAVNLPIEYIIADMKARDEVARAREREWRDTCSTIANSKDKPKRPEGLAVQVLSADMTNAAFVQRLADAKGKFLYTMMDEVELLDALRTNGRAGSVSQIIRLAFDRGMYGQERVAATAVNEQVRVRWNWNASTTVQRGRKYFQHAIADGTLSRLSLSTIVRDKYDWRNIPKFGTYGKPFAEALAPYIDRLNACRGTLHCPEALAWAEQVLDEQISFAESSDDEAYATLSYRAVLMGFLRAMVLYVMSGCKWSSTIAEFAEWTVRYDMWCKMHFFGDLLHQDLEAEYTAEQRNPRNMLALLPSEFTRQMAQEMRLGQGRNPNPKNMLGQWIHRGYIVYDEARGVYVKVER